MEAVYIFENQKAKLVKVGITHLWTSGVKDRLNDLNNQWLGNKVTCQICGYKRFIDDNGLMKNHVVSGKTCPGGNKLPLEKNTSIAQNYLHDLKLERKTACGDEKSSITRKINKIEQRIKTFDQQDIRVGQFTINTIFYTESAEIIEQLSHKILIAKFTKYSKLGEVFCCSSSDAIMAVEQALSSLGILHLSRKEN